jgi:MSHA biogenesis protein MshQ
VKTSNALLITALAVLAVGNAAHGQVVLGGFNAFETATRSGAISGVIKTKIAGTPVSLAIVALNAAKNAVAKRYLGTVRVELLDASDNSGALDPYTGCYSSWTVIQTLSDVTFADSDNGRKNISFSQANSYRNARLRMSSPAGAPTVIACSSDNFAIRPHQFTNLLVTDNDWETAGTGRTLSNLWVNLRTIHKAGRPFTVRATAVNGAGTPATTTNYAGTPSVTVGDCGVFSACFPNLGTLVLDARFAAGELRSDVATYTDVGSFTLWLVDSTFAAVDDADGSTPAERDIKSNAVYVGRFVPDHFAVSFNTPSFIIGCATEGFTYATPPVLTVIAQTFTNSTTNNYHGVLWRITHSTLSGKAYTAASGTLDASGITGADPVIAPSGDGTGTITFGSGTGLFSMRSTALAPVDADISLAIKVIDADGVAYSANPARFGEARPGHGIPVALKKACPARPSAGTGRRGT